MRIPILDLKAQYSQIKQEIDQAVAEVLESQNFVLGPQVEKCEKILAQYSQCRFAVGVSSGTDAILLALMAEGIGPGDEIKILMWGRLDATYELVVDNEGFINLPKVGPLTAAGLTFGELKELIRVKQEAITGVNVSVSMGRLRTIRFSYWEK